MASTSVGKDKETDAEKESITPSTTHPQHASEDEKDDGGAWKAYWVCYLPRARTP
jgi:hypothetical protein